MSERRTPANAVAEQGVISCLLSSPRSITKVIDRLKPDHFDDDDLATCYTAICAVYGRGKAPTIANVADELVRKNGGDVSQVQWSLTRMEDSTAILTPVEDHAEVVIRASKNRRLIGIAAQIADSAYRQEENSMALAEELIMALALDNDIKAASSMPDMVDRYMREYTQRRIDVAEGRSIGVRTGFHGVDKLIGSLRPATLNILAARTSVGKSALAGNFAFNTVKKSGGRVLFFSLEMLLGELMQRFLAMDTHIDQSQFRDGKTTDEEHHNALLHAQELRRLDFHATDNVYRLDAIKSVARMMHMRKPLDLVVIDYLQLIDVPPTERGRQKARYEEIGEITKGLKRLAQELNVPVLTLAQLSRESTRSSDPELNHLGESGRIENDADTVALLHVDPEELEKKNKSLPYTVEYRVRKDRNGRLGTAKLMFLPPQTRFADIVEY